jgi:hypothetical protein
MNDLRFGPLSLSNVFMFVGGIISFNSFKNADLPSGL